MKGWNMSDAQPSQSRRPFGGNIALSRRGSTGDDYVDGDIVADWPDFGRRSIVTEIVPGGDFAPFFGGYGVRFEGVGGIIAVGVLRNGNCRVVGRAS